MRQQLVDTPIRMRRESCQHVLEVGPRIVPMHPRRLRQAHDGGCALASELAACEKPCLAPHRPGSHEILEVVVVTTHVAVLEEAAEWRPAVQAVVDRRGDAAAVGHTCAFGAQPFMQLVPVRPGLLLPHRKPIWRGGVAGLLLDLKDPGQATDAQLKFKDAKLQKLTFELARLKRLKFGVRTEAMTADQRRLFEETLAEDEADLQARIQALHGDKTPAPPPAKVAPSASRAASQFLNTCVASITTTSRRTPAARRPAAVARWGASART
jgi:hypothetical protein